MRKIENDCCDCGLPCINCGLKSVEHTYCDRCGEEIGSDEYPIIYNDEELCELCFRELLINTFLGTDEAKRKFLATTNPFNSTEWIEQADSDLLLLEVNEFDFEDIVSYLREIGHKVEFRIGG